MARRAPDDLVERAVELGLTGLAVTDHAGLYGAVRFVSAAEAAGLHPVVGLEIELLDPAVADPDRRRDRATPGDGARAAPDAGRGPATRRRRDRGRPGPAAARTRPAARPSRAGQGGPARDRRARSRPAPRPAGPLAVGWRSLCRLVSQANMAGTKGVPRFSQALLARAHRGARRAVRLPRRRDRPPPAGGRSGRRPGRRGALRDGSSGGATGPAGSGFFIELSHHLLPDDDWLVAEVGGAGRASSACRSWSTNDVHYARREDRELADVLTAIRHGRTLETLGRPAPARRRVVPEVRRGAGGLPPGSARRPDRAGLGGGHRHLGRARGVVLGRPRRSSSTASRASRSRTGRRRSPTSRSCAGRARAAATTR